MEEKFMSDKQFFKRTAIIVSVIMFITLALMLGIPQYRVYSLRKSGEAALAEAESSKKVAIEQARATKESANLLAEADTIRAHGVARSNAIIGTSLHNNEAYLRWLWIDNIEKNPQAVIYVPTEANLPILEAGRRPYRDTTR